MTATFHQGDARKLPLSDKSVDLVIGSPPYGDARTYDDGTIPAGHMVCRTGDAWIDWMLDVTREGLRVSRGLVLWVCTGTGTGGLNYDPMPEGLIYKAKRAGLPVLRPDYWIANKAPAGTAWFSNTVEYVCAFGDAGKFDAEPIATAVKYGNGGAFQHRARDGTRVNGSNYPAHGMRKTCPNGFYVAVGGGLMGHDLACSNEAPYPEGVPERFILSCTKPGDTVLDPVSGGGTTACVASKLGRIGIGFDIRTSQVELARRRYEDVVGLFGVKA